MKITIYNKKKLLNTSKQNRKQMQISVFRDSVLPDNGYYWQFWFIRDITVKGQDGFAFCKSLSFYALCANNVLYNVHIFIAIIMPLAK